MVGQGGVELRLIRHAPVLSDGCAYGRRDLDADLSDASSIDRLRGLVGDPGRLVASPARRCCQTAEALWPGQNLQTDAGLWEQDLGDWEGRPYCEIPDLGPIDRDALSAHAPPGGESFAQVAERVAKTLPALLTGARDVTLVAHAGTVRAALGYALGAISPALAFEVAPLSLTRIAVLADGQAIVRSVNERP
ncbi:MAG: histidine phosphatase family protein [Alphaproteobacteria bacterium]|nr:histidine phosphatase family protein [Alphaproteobacteria bacterium]